MMMLDALKVAPAPIITISGTLGVPSTAKIYLSHLHRLEAVLDAARSGNALLIQLAVAHADKWGSGDEN